MAGHMRTSGTDLSTYKIDLAKTGFDYWLERLSKNSKIVQKGGKLLPRQVTLLDKIFQYFAKDKRNVLVLSAPPASGKSHVICLISADLVASGLKTAIVVPSSELQHDFSEGFEMTMSKKDRPAVVNMQEFIHEREKYQIAILDEAHNIRSSFELNSSIYRELDITNLAPRLNWLLYDGNGKIKSFTKVIDGEEKESLLRIVAKKTQDSWFTEIYRSRSNWIVAISTFSNLIHLHLLVADPERRMVTAKDSTIFVSATPLTNEELSLYCGIESKDVCRVNIGPEDTVQPTCTFLAPAKKINVDVSFAIACSILLKKSVRTLILANRPITYKKWWEKLSTTKLNSRLVGIIGGEGGRSRLRKFKQYMSKRDSILLTNSSVFWEAINIKGLKLLIVVEPPNPRPNLIDVYNGTHKQFATVMQSRMIQGLGRIGRRPAETGSCLILFPYHHKQISQFELDARVSIDSIVQQIVKTL